MVIFVIAIYSESPVSTRHAVAPDSRKNSIYELETWGNNFWTGTQESSSNEKSPYPQRRLKYDYTVVTVVSVTISLTVFCIEHIHEADVEHFDEGKPQNIQKGKQKPEIQSGHFLSRIKTPWKIGAHVSAAGGVENSIVNASSIGYI